MMEDFTLPGMGMEAGGGFILGFITGYGAKIVAKIIAVLIGVQLALFKFLESKGVIVVNWDRLSSVAGDTANEANVAVEGQDMFMSMVSTIPLGAGFTAGAVLGFKRA